MQKMQKIQELFPVEGFISFTVDQTLVLVFEKIR